jgi:GGDEF domain-containing protein
VEIFHEILSRTAMEGEIARLKQLALLDPLTGVGNRATAKSASMPA